jgi:uncharacterized protein (TIGR02596 family)
MTRIYTDKYKGMPRKVGQNSLPFAVQLPSVPIRVIRGKLPAWRALRPSREAQIFCAASKRRAFSLLELLVGIAIMMILMALVLPATSSLMKSMGMGRAVSMITDEMNFARQTALSRNRDVEVRFYRMGSKLDANNKQYRAYRTLLADGIDSAKAQPLSKVKYLPDNVIASGDAAFSTLLDYANSNRSGLVHSNETLPAGATEYISFLFRANGGTSLRPVTGTNSLWYLTLQGENVQTNAATGLPYNYFTAEIDPVTGRLRGYRP